MSNTMKHSQSFSTRADALAYLTGLRQLIPAVPDREIWFRTEAHDGIAADRWTVHMYSRPREGRRNVGHRLDANAITGEVAKRFEVTEHPDPRVGWTVTDMLGYFIVATFKSETQAKNYADNRNLSA